MEQLILRDLKTVLQCKQFGKLCHESLQDVGKSILNNSHTNTIVLCNM